MLEPIYVTVDELERWELFGARWRVVHLSDEHAEVELRTCAGEPLERRVSNDLRVIGYLRSFTRARIKA
jgi:hypothetical protein